LLTISGYLAAAVFFVVTAKLINGVFKVHLQSAESLCTLQIWHVAAALGGACLLGLVACGLAAWRVGRIEPAEALCHE
jgi:putative ABC transport system permease protein